MLIFAQILNLNQLFLSNLRPDKKAIMKIRLILYLILIVLTSNACQDRVKIVPVPDNTAPPDFSVPLVLKENYVNKLYITLLGRKPTQAEFTANIGILNQDNASAIQRKQVLDGILAQEEFIQRQYDIARIEILENLDTVQISQNIFFLSSLLTQPEYEPFYTIIHEEIDKLQELRAVPLALKNGTINRIEMHRRFVFNLFYDEINMGSQNFVLSIFEHFLGRYPTESEEEKAILMVNGFNTVVFGMEGNSKSDFIDIFFNSGDYFEGEVIDIYEDFLFRSPDSYEMGDASSHYIESNKDYRELLKHILSKDEFLGIE